MPEITNEDVKKSAYFSNRAIDESVYSSYSLPRYLRPYFTDEDKDLQILDIGCGLGQTLNYLKQKGFKNLYGIDINEEAIAACKSKGIDAEKVNDTRDFAKNSQIKYDRFFEHGDMMAAK